MSFRGYGNFYYWLKAKIEKIRYFPKEVKWFVQRGKRGYADSDVWDFDCYLSKVVLGGLKWLQKHKHGYPATLDPITGNFDYDMKRWEMILQEMIDGFEILNICIGGDDLNYGKYLPDDVKQSIETKMKINYPNLRFTTREEEQKIDKSFDLLKQYFLSLWD